MKSYFEEMFQYERWANDRILVYLKEPPTNPHLLKVFNHLVADALPWLFLLRGEVVPETIIETMHSSPQWTVEECRARLDALHSDIERFLDSLAEADFSRTIASMGPQGKLFQNTLAEILTHLLSHGQHHRGQIEWLVEQESGVYLATSFMPYLRQRETTRGGSSPNAR